jgi:hypothetical protein
LKRISLLGVILLVGCSATPNPEFVPSLDQADTIHAVQLLHSDFAVTASGGLMQSPQSIALAVKDLELDLRTGDHPQLLALSIPIGDVQVSAQAFPPSGLELRDVTLLIEGPVDVGVVHAQADALEVSARVPLTLSWGMMLDDGTVWKLGPTRTDPVAVDVQVFKDGGSFTATVDAQCAGRCWSLDGVADLSDGKLDVQAAAEVRSAE